MEEQERSREGPASARGLCQAGTQTDPSLAVGGGGEWPGLDLHRGLLRQHPDPAARWQGFATSLGLSFLTSEMG